MEDQEWKTKQAEDPCKAENPYKAENQLTADNFQIRIRVQFAADSNGVVLVLEE